MGKGVEKLSWGFIVNGDLFFIVAPTDLKFSEAFVKQKKMYAKYAIGCRTAAQRFDIKNGQIIFFTVFHLHIIRPKKFQD